MAAYLNRTVSMMAGDGPHNKGSISAIASDFRAIRNTPQDNSPLQIFVKAKRKINDIFGEIEDYVKDAIDYMHVVEKELSILNAEEVKQMETFVNKVHGIRDVLARDHMKVAFFGRTSNGKSSVINAMLRDKVLPSGIGHTTNCFLQVEGSPADEPYLVLEGSDEHCAVESVGQLAHALCKEKLNESQLVRVFWPRNRCVLLRDDVVFVDSPGVDVSPNLDEWIDKHCLDADVFVLVANAESTLMVTEKNFFHKVSTKLSKPNIFILNNRWDASATEPEFLDQVRRQHLERGIDFLVKELKVCTPKEADERIFFISAKEALIARLAEKGFGSSNSLAEGFQNRYFEFEDFERKFEECISKSAVKTKFEQHSQRGKYISNELRNILDKLYHDAQLLKEEKLKQRKDLNDKINFTEQQLMLITQDMKQKIHDMVDDVGQRVAKALNEEIRRLSNLVDEFNLPFHPEPLVLNVYKKELHAHVESGLGSNLRARLSTALALNVEASQQEMLERLEKLIPDEKKGTSIILPRRQPFEILYRLNCDNLCADFKEDLEFRFSWGITTLIQRFAGSGAGYLALKNKRDSPTSSIIPNPSSPTDLYPNHQNNIVNDDWSLIAKLALASATSQGTMGGLLVAGFLFKTVGWRVIAVTGAIYGCLYLYERLTWTNRAKEKAFKRQYVAHATKKLKLIVDLTSSNCSYQVQQELSGTFARLCHLVDEATTDMDAELKALEVQVRNLENAAGRSKVLRNKANYLTHELELFEDAYLKPLN
ncbi:transmembrane GTPase Marf isoform X1 [Agrilus planipennis]|uniref:Transmembrane GTPase Marf isoform X1 n=1 Tax=Agrilus planipennis TaxID=224129 RepID=A0A7F5RCS1_AGRPL|nr:transmembrane GTPase Marf isoform X1 [Agrilus planipennis]XP_025833770.1 transmembrane GTPase Marf isoform X2 [Agrilus planipennis]XP_025833771.1 transmembrane GTPase Marf isoform X1 [Agrilus planipennis]XP_025833772.1 transmembrane GTPase Marf isoform X1 [Agrilus planipennis]XP_025833773.1 transmembrane GTPase Marf isoform X1 [Agrilus planipennis]XP_025833774.1 transmembrane GTPase Marf isoform X1 [Agrilus planipennis]